MGCRVSRVRTGLTWHTKNQQQQQLYKEQFRQNSINPFRQERSLSNGVNISGPYILTIPSSLQIISIRSIDLKTVPVILRINLW